MMSDTLKRKRSPLVPAPVPGGSPASAPLGEDAQAHYGTPIGDRRNASATDAAPPGLEGSAPKVPEKAAADVVIAQGVVLPKNMAVLEKVPKGRPQISITKGGSLKKLIGNRNGAAPQAQIR